MNGMRQDNKNTHALNTDRTQRDSLGLDEDIGIGWVQHEFTDKLLCHRYCSLVRDAQIREIIQKST